MKATPRHVAIIMDGNGRWAEERGHGRTRGHREGAKRVDDIVTECANIGVRYLTLYAFSTENWNRPSAEVAILMRLLVQHLKTMDKKCLKNGVALVAQGSLERLPKFVQKELKRVMEVTAVPKPKLILNLALSYGGRQEIADAARRIAERVRDGEVYPEQVDEKFFQKHLYHPEFPDPDLLIRTGGEYRVSNFLLWEIAYSEIVVTKTLWPDFNALELQACLDTFRTRQRRFGKTGEQLKDRTDEAPANA